MPKLVISKINKQGHDLARKGHGNAAYVVIKLKTSRFQVWHVLAASLSH